MTARAQGALRSWTCFILAFGLIGKSAAVTVDSSYDQVSQACAQCDYQFAVAALAYQNTFGLFSKAIDGAKYHCRKMANVSQCYDNCQAGSIYTYSSQNKGIFDLFYRDYCDPACYTAILPFCYLKAFGTIDNSLTCSGNIMNADLRECLRAELFEKQNCSSGCTPGQRKALYLFMQLQIPCLFSYTTQINCYTSVQYCTDKYFGDSGSDYTGLTDPILTTSNNASCKYFSTDYISCLENALSGTISFGENSFITTYDTPCQSTEAQISFLEDFTEVFIAAPFCEAELPTLNAVCPALVTTWSTSYTSTTSARTTTQTLATSILTSRSTSNTSTTNARTTTQTLATSILTSRSTSITSTANAARTTTWTLTTSAPAIGSTSAENVLQTNASTATQSRAANRNHSNYALDVELTIEWLNLKNAALSLAHMNQSSLNLHVPIGLLLLLLHV